MVLGLGFNFRVQGVGLGVYGSVCAQGFGF